MRTLLQRVVQFDQQQQVLPLAFIAANAIFTNKSYIWNKDFSNKNN